jgi:hypothetical protein
MKFNFKTIIIGGLVFYVAQFAVSMITGILIHEGVLDALYNEHNAFWRPELRSDPPDMAALMPRWITVGLVMAFIYTTIYDNIREALTGPGPIQGLKYGLLLAIITGAMAVGYSGLFDLPDTIWVWWIVDGFIMLGIGGLALGWYVAKWGD